MQVCEAEFHRREVPRLQRRGPRRKARSQGQYVLWLQQLSEVQIHVGQQADRRNLPELRQRISGREESEGWPRHCLRQQGVRIRASCPGTSSAREPTAARGQTVNSGCRNVACSGCSTPKRTCRFPQATSKATSL